MPSARSRGSGAPPALCRLSSCCRVYFKPGSPFYNSEPGSLLGQSASSLQSLVDACPLAGLLFPALQCLCSHPISSTPTATYGHHGAARWRCVHQQTDADVLAGFLLCFFILNTPLILSDLLKIPQPQAGEELACLARLLSTSRQRRNRSAPCPSGGTRDKAAHQGTGKVTAPPQWHGGDPLAYLTTGWGMASALAGTWTPFSHSWRQGSART